MDTKLATLKQHAAAGRWRDAVRIAARFPQLGAQRNAILDAHMAYTNPRFLAQIGRDVEAAKAAGIAALKERYQLV